jgi:hypothetical protein
VKAGLQPRDQLAAWPVEGQTLAPEAAMVPFAGLLAALDQIPDPRRRQGQRNRLAPLLLFAVLAVLAGATSYRRIRLFIGVHRERLNATFGARFRRAPAVNTLRALMHALDPAAIEAAFRRHAEHLGDAASPSRAALSTVARLRSFALTILRAHGVGNVSEAIYTNALSLDHLLAYGLPKSQN